MNIIRLIVFFAAKDGDALYSPQKQDRELRVDSDLNWRQGKPLGNSGMRASGSVVPGSCNPTDCGPQAPLSMGFSRQEHWSG